MRRHDMKTTKRRLATVAAVLALAAILVGASCDLFLHPLIKVRIEHFIADLNSDRSVVYKNLSSTNTSDYNAAKVSSFWDTYFPGTSGYSISNIDDTNFASVTAKITGTNGGFGGTKDATFKMFTDGVDYYIQELTLGGTTVVK